jgi:hypothetical protein
MVAGDPKILLKANDSARSFKAIIRDVYYTRSNGRRVKKGPSLLPLFLCLPNESTFREEGANVVQSFVAGDSDSAEFAYRAAVNLLRISRDTKQYQWHKIIEDEIRSPLADKLQAAAKYARSCGLLNHLFHYRPATVPDFYRNLR